ncbi:MAG: hypothetical protein BWY31_03800 [Lentisphaerae bacterium ADurb.Bin242]|nr:MAG: hypothetical protein BWY31_03800 [Lentisphaerae bacterium ADurb.Bin242]
MAEKKWYETHLRRILVDMHIPDWDPQFMSRFSAENYAEMMKLANVSTAEIYAGSCLGLCYWPTRVGYAHRQLNGRDLLGETIAACEKRGIPVQIYLNVWNLAAYKEHPEWRLLFENGKGSCENKLWDSSRYGICCINTGFGDFFLRELDELNSLYKGVGYWIDMLGWWGVVCHCPGCAVRFREETGYESIPEIADWNDQCFIALAKCRERWLGEYARKIHDTIQKKTPDRTVTIQSGSITLGWHGGINPDFIRASDFLAGDFYGGLTEQSVISKLFGRLSAHRPMEFMIPRCENLLQHTTERPLSNLRMRSFSAIANQSSFTLIDAIDPVGTLDRRFYEHARAVNDSYRRYEKYIDASSVPMADAALYFSSESQVNVETAAPAEKRAEVASKQGAGRHNLAEILISEHLLYTFTGGFDPDLRKHPLILLHDASRLPDRECEAIREYVRNGGKLYASANTSLYDPETGLRPDFRLADVFGVHYDGKTDPLTYIAPVRGSFLEEFCTPEYPVILDSRQILLKPDPDTEILGELVLPVSGPDEPEFFGSAISNPPMIRTGRPALVRHRFGKGEAIYCAGMLENMGYDFQKRIVGALLRRLTGPGILRTNAPKTVEITLFRQEERKRWILNVLNMPSDLPPQPLYGIRIGLRLPAGLRPDRLLAAPEETPVPFEPTADGIRFTLEELHEFAMLILVF